MPLRHDPTRRLLPRLGREPYQNRAPRRGPVLAAAGLAALALLGVSACSSSGGSDTAHTTDSPSATTTKPAPAPTGPSGTASVKVTGGDEPAGSYDLAYAPAEDDSYDVDAGKIKLTWSDSAHHVFNLSVSDEKIAAGKISGAVTLKFGGDDKGYVDGLHDRCEVTLTGVGPGALTGRYTCRGVPGWSFADVDWLTTSVDAEGTFSYAEPGAAPPAAPATTPADSANAADLVVTGGDAPGGNHRLAYDPSADDKFDPESGDYDLTWSDSAHHVLNISATDTELKPGTAGMTTTIRLGDPDTGFVDGMQTQCTVKLSAVGAHSLAGSFDCHGVTGFNYATGEQLKTKIDAHGTFGYAG